MSSPALPVAVWQQAADQLATPNLTLIHEDFKTAYSGALGGTFKAIMDAYAEYLAFLLAKFEVKNPSVTGHIAAYRKVSAKTRETSVLSRLFFDHLRPVQQALRGWRKKSLTELANSIIIESHQAKHYEDSTEKNVAKFAMSFTLVHNLIRYGIVLLAPHYQEKGFTCFPDGVFEVRSGRQPHNIGYDGKPSGQGSATRFFRIQISIAGDSISAHGYPISEPEFDQYRKKKLDTTSGTTDSKKGVMVEFVELDWTNVPTAVVQGDVKFKLR